MPSHPKSKYPQVVAFSAANPLPKTPQGLADALLDMATILATCQEGQARHWSKLSLDIIHNGESNPYPGAFLSNPALLASTRSESRHGTSMGSMGAGCFFSYSHYQEDSLGPALLMAAFSPRTHKPKRSAKLYAQAMLLLVERGEASAARLHLSSVEGAGLERLARGEITPQQARHAFMALDFDAAALSRLGSLRTDLAGKAIALALSDDKPGLFDGAARSRLQALAIRRAAMAEAKELSGSLAPAAPGRRTPRV